MQFLTGRKHGQSLEALGRRFYGSIAKQSLQKQRKNYPKVHGQNVGGARTIAPAEYATVFNAMHAGDFRDLYKDCVKLYAHKLNVLILWS